MNYASTPPPVDMALSCPVSGIVLNAGSMRFAEPTRVTDEEPAGLKLVVILQGEMAYRLNDGEQCGIAGPASHLCLSDTPLCIEHDFAAAASLRYVAMQMPGADPTGILGVEAEPLLRALEHQRGRSPAVAQLPACKTVQSLGRQMMLCPMQGHMRRIYLFGKALELLSTVVASAGTGGARPRVLMGTRDLNRLYAARAIVLENLHAPPSLPELSKQVGTNASKLAQGFKQVFGMSVFGFVREQRMERAYRMLATGEVSVADAAHACGYTDSHFAKVFYRRYRVLPSTLR